MLGSVLYVSSLAQSLQFVVATYSRDVGVGKVWVCSSAAHWFAIGHLRCSWYVGSRSGTWCVRGVLVRDRARWCARGVWVLGTCDYVIE